MPQEVTDAHQWFEEGLRASQVASLVVTRVEESRQTGKMLGNHDKTVARVVDSRNDDVGSEQKCSLEVVTPAIQDQEVDHKGGNKETDGLKQGEVQGHVLVHAPAQDDDKWGDEDGYNKGG